MAGLVIDISDPGRVRLRLTTDGPDVPGYERVVRWTGPVIEAPTTFSARAGRGVVARLDDDLAGKSIAELLGMAKPLGYKEDPSWPNGGVRTMRVKNFIRHHRKEKASTAK